MIDTITDRMFIYFHFQHNHNHKGQIHRIRSGGHQTFG